MARQSSARLFRYRLLVALIFPLLAAHAAWLAVRSRNSRYVRERLGFFSPDEGAALWVHAASVGEVNAVLPLLRVLRARHPHRRLLLTTATLTGARTAQEKLPEVAHHFLPLDRVGGVRRFLSRMRPACALVVETELWPNLYAACAGRGIPLIIVNGRVSDRTLRAPRWVRDLYAQSLGQIHAVLARTEEDRARFVRLGAPAAKVEVTGNIKFAAAPSGETIAPVGLGRPYVLAASTREGEEKLVVEAWERADVASHLLVIAPRHPRRLRSILQDLGARSVVVRSRGEEVGPTTAIYIADTLGELPSFMAGADLVFMGGSLVQKGGQNLLEPAALGKAVVVGPHMENFAAETSLLAGENGLVRIGDAMELAQCLATLLTDVAARGRLGANARRVVDARRDMAERYADALERLCP